MDVNRNGIPVVATKKKQRRKPLKYELDKITFWRKEAGQIVTVVVPKFSHLKQALKEDEWRVLKNDKH